MEETKKRDYNTHISGFYCIMMLTKGGRCFMKKAIGLIVGLALLMLTVCGLTAMAETVDSGELNDNISWTLDSEGVLTFSGEGEIEDNDLEYTLRQKVITVVYGPGISYIEPGGFSYSYNLTAFVVDSNNPNYVSVDGIVYNKDMTELIECPTAKTGDLVIPATVTKICHDAFIGNHLSSVTLPDGLTSIVYQAFWNSEYLTEITLPAGYTGYDTSVFNGCDAMTAFYVSEDNTEYAAKDGLLYSKDMKTLIRVPGGYEGELTTADGVTEIYPCAFERCGTLTSVTLAEGVETIGGNAFSGSGIANVSLPKSLKTIENGAFSNADAVTNVQYAGSKAEWDQIEIGENNASLLFRTIHCTDGDIPSKPITGSIGSDAENPVTYSLTVDGDLTVTGAGAWKPWAFMNSKLIKTATLESGVSEIGWGGFDWCRNLTSVTIPDTVTAIKFEAFYGCQSLETITIPATVTTLGNEVFDCCDALTDITFKGTMAAWKTLTEGTDNQKIKQCTVHCSDGDIEDVSSGKCGDNVTWKLNGGKMTISGTGPMYDYTWDRGQWEDKDAITSVVIEEGVTYVGELAFYTCSNLRSISLPSTVTEIGDYAFYVCDLGYVTIPKNVTSIGTWAFGGNDELYSINVAEDNPNYSDYGGALYNKEQTILLQCPAGRSRITIPEGVLSVDRAFQACHQLMSVALPEGITSIGGYTFSNMDRLTNVAIPRSVTSIQYDAFRNCKVLTDIYYYGTRAEWEQIDIDESNEPLFKDTCTIHCMDDEETGTCGDNLTWTFSNGTLTITGNGEIPEYYSEEPAPWENYRHMIHAVVLGDGVTGINGNGFCQYEKLATVTLPGSLKTLGYATFAECNISSIVIPAGVETKTFDFFYQEADGKEHLYHIKLPAGITDTGYGAFCCNPLPYDNPDFILPNGVTTIEAEAFYGASPRFVWLPENTETIGASAFASCSGLQYVYIPYGCESIAADAFPEGTTILGLSGYGEETTAAKYAKDNGYAFIELEDLFGGNG